MIKRTIKETTREYDENGALIRETITETVEDDDAQYVPYCPSGYNPLYPSTGMGVCYRSTTTSSESNLK